MTRVAPREDVLDRECVLPVEAKRQRRIAADDDVAFTRPESRDVADEVLAGGEIDRRRSRIAQNSNHPMASPAERQLAGFIAKYSPALARQARAARRRMQARLPGAVEMVYDNYNWLVIGYAPNERPSDAVFSLVVNPGGWVTLCFLEGAHLPDPEKLLRGSGNRVRHIRLTGPADLDLPGVRALMAAAMREADPPFEAGARRKLVIRAVSARQRPRSPSE